MQATLALFNRRTFRCSACPPEVPVPPEPPVSSSPEPAMLTMPSSVEPLPPPVTVPVPLPSVLPSVEEPSMEPSMEPSTVQTLRELLMLQSESLVQRDAAAAVQANRR